LSLFITFEGPDGSGKSTQIKMLANYLAEENIPYCLTREPGGTDISNKIRSVILDPSNLEMQNETEVLLYAASRAQHVREKIIPALEEGKVVLCDRFLDASIAYQGYGLGIPLENIKAVNAFATKGITPNRTYLLDISPEEGRSRMEERLKQNGETMLDRIEQKDYTYHETVREGFHQLATENKSRIRLLHANQTIEDLFTQIKEDFDAIWKNRNL
jgi:dTMP kinase